MVFANDMISKTSLDLVFFAKTKGVFQKSELAGWKLDGAVILTMK